MRKEKFITGEYYHIFNRGVDERNVFTEQYDVLRFFQSMEEFNTIESIGSIYENSFLKRGDLAVAKKKLVDFVCYCLNPNHFHFILKQREDGGISLFMKKLTGGYARYFNERYDRTGFLFQGRFKAKHIFSNDYLLYLSAYVNLNNLVHSLSDPTSKLKIKSSWEEYTKGLSIKKFCNKEVILEQFRSAAEYKNYANEALSLMQQKKKDDKDLVDLKME